MANDMISLLKDLENNLDKPIDDLLRLIKKYQKADGSHWNYAGIIEQYKKLAGTQGLKKFNPKLVEKILMKPVRTLSGVAPVTVLTKPYPCPGKCIFCPNDLRMPKSYLAEEPGAQRAEKNYFDPYLQVTNRLEALNSMGHQVDKVELIILGGTWTAYPLSYQIWFVKECFRALNDFQTKNDSLKIQEKYQDFQKKFKESEKKWKTKSFLNINASENKENFSELQIKGEDISETYNELISKYYLQPENALGVVKYQKANWEELELEQVKNETALQRSVGLVIETRPDEITPESVKNIRRLGATKVQLGIQSLDDEILRKNKRGHNVAVVRKAFSLLRQAGFKLHIHFMANLYGGSVAKDKRDFARLFKDQDFRPDELKIYPCSLIETAELMKYYKKGLWKPYSYEELLEITAFTLTHTPLYCRITRMIRDIPSQDIVVGNTKSNFRQIAEQHAIKTNQKMQDIRSREIRSQSFEMDEVKLQIKNYKTSVSQEKFLQFTYQDKILAFLRLSLPLEKKNQVIDELDGAAMIREIHVYGRSLAIGQKEGEDAQHFGFGKKLIAKAAALSKKVGYSKLAVISAIGTKEYYRKRGFTDGELYQFLDLRKIED
jgi:elongator complex protein 3